MFLGLYMKRGSAMLSVIQIELSVSLIETAMQAQRLLFHRCEVNLVMLGTLEINTFFLQSIFFQGNPYCQRAICPIFWHDLQCFHELIFLQPSDNVCVSLKSFTKDRGSVTRIDRMTTQNISFYSKSIKQNKPSTKAGLLSSTNKKN